MFYLFKRPRSARRLGDICKTPTRLNWWLNGMFSPIRYKPDLKEYKINTRWQTSFETLHMRIGGCKAFALLAYDTLKCLKYKPLLVVAWGWDGHSVNFEGHAVCVFYWGSSYHYIDNWGIKKCGTVLNEVPFFIFKNAKKAKVYNAKGKIKKKWTAVSREFRAVS